MNLELCVSLRSRILSTRDMVTESHVVSELFLPQNLIGSQIAQIQCSTTIKRGMSMAITLQQMVLNSPYSHNWCIRGGLVKSTLLLLIYMLEM
jgi:hypothetical protein